MGQVKALLEFRGETFIHRLIRVLGAACARVIVVTGFHAEVVAAAADGAQVVQNPAPERGMGSSLQAGLAALGRELPPVMFTPVDIPAIGESTPFRLIEAYRAAPAPVIQPAHDGRRGHPVLISPEVARELLAAPPDTAPNVVLARHAALRTVVPVDDPGILADVDYPADYQRLLSHP